MSAVEEIQSGLCLRVTEGSHQQEFHDLSRAEIAIGRAAPETPYSPAYLTFPEPTLSRLHAVLTWDEKARSYVAHHKSQTNPTLINGRQLKKPTLLSPGDTLALGRLVVVLEQARTVSGKTERLSAEEPMTTLVVTSSDSDRSYNIPVDRQRLELQFTDTRTTAAIGAEETESSAKVVRISAQAPNSVSFTVDSEGIPESVETKGGEPEALRLTKLSWGTLQVPVRPGAPLPMRLFDTIQHQRHVAKFTHRGGGEYSESTLDGSEKRESSSKPKSEADIPPPPASVLTFLNGAWLGATVTIPGENATAFELGPKSSSFPHLLPLANSPSCRITVSNGQARLLVTQVSDHQFVDVNGELYFTGESISLCSGSKILLGEYEFLWAVPELHERYSQYEVVASTGNLPIRKQVSRIGTAAHCEIRLPLPQLAPVVGRLTFENDRFIYHHLNIAMSGRIDGIETSAGLEAMVGPGSKLELAPDVTISIEGRNC